MIMGRKSRGEINTHHMFFKVTTTRRKHLLWQRLAFCQIQLDVYPFVLCFASRRSFAIKTRDIWFQVYIYIYSTKSIQTWNLWKFEPLWESRLFFVSLFRWVKSAWKLSTYPWGWKTSNWACVFGPIHDNKPSKRHPKSREFPWLIPESLRAGTEWTSHMQDEEQNLSHQKNISVESIANLLFSTKHLQIYLDEISPYCSKREVNEYCTQCGPSMRSHNGQIIGGVQLGMGDQLVFVYQLLQDFVSSTLFHHSKFHQDFQVPKKKEESWTL